MKPLRTLLADDHAILREGLVRLLEESGLCTVVGQAADGMAALAEAERLSPDLVVTDLSMPRLNGMEVARRLKAARGGPKVIVLTHQSEREYVLPLIEAGADGYVVKDGAGEQLVAAVRVVRDGGRYLDGHAQAAVAEGGETPDPYGTLTEREREVLHLICDGATTKEIASTLGIGDKTAENHRGRVLRKLDLGNTAELVRYAARHGLVD